MTENEKIYSIKVGYGLWLGLHNVFKLANGLTRVSQKSMSISVLFEICKIVLLTKHFSV